MTEITGEALGIAGFALAQAVHAWAFAREGAHRLVDSDKAADVITVDFCQHHRWRQVARPYGRRVDGRSCATGHFGSSGSRAPLALLGVSAPARFNSSDVLVAPRVSLV